MIYHKLLTSIPEKVNNCIEKFSLATIGNYFPIQCGLCCKAVYNKYLCDYCDKSIVRLNNICSHCQWPIASGIFKCNLCIETDFDWADIQILSPYVKPIDRIIHQFKYNYDLTKGRVLADLLLKKLDNNLKHIPEAIIPVPLYKSKLKQRGFNQTIELGEYIAKKLNIKLDYNLFAKYKNTKTQMSQDKIARINNVAGSFCFNQRPKYKSVAILDDVVTTGSTVTVLAQLLASANVEKISIWAIARSY